MAVTLNASSNISGVALNPSTALSKTKSGDDFVKFTNTDGSVKVTVKAKGGQLAIKARAKTLSDLLGTGTWSADVFGTGYASRRPPTRLAGRQWPPHGGHRQRQHPAGGIT